ncbi:thioredoxin family protein [Paenibacillus physcomitrellae]|uniref:Thioredoxin n=1 Tax=Paenibacillus physcomitrellae TaxID=1619311 RepID=A0ABQ1GUL9_9BACL|nr:thioredoxin family protein [Paenibacillus physcomitrellae]GGA50633.1 thioredoxin [Paenibacillus physcomitrellae]
MSRKSNVAHKFGKGLTPAQFIESMTQNKEAFVQGYEQFAWPAEEDREFFESLQFRDDLRVLIVAADWCGDVIRNIPVVFRLLEAAEIPTEVLILEEHPEVMDEYMTLGGRSIPIVIVADTGGSVLAFWGPRPKHIQAIMAEFKTANPDREVPGWQEGMAETRRKMIEAYGEGTAIHPAVVSEFRELLSGV